MTASARDLAAESAPALARSRLTPLLQQALSMLPEPQQLDTARIAVLSELGFKDMEIAKQLGLTWKQLEDRREQLRAGIVEAMRSDGFADSEIARDLRVPTGAVASLRLQHKPTCMVALSGEREAVCSCEGTG